MVAKTIIFAFTFKRFIRIIFIVQPIKFQVVASTLFGWASQNFGTFLSSVYKVNENRTITKTITQFEKLD